MLGEWDDDDHDVPTKMRQAARAFVTLAVHHEANGRADAAADAYVSMLQMNQSFRNDAFVIVYLVQQGIRSVVNGGIGELLGRQTLSRAMLDTLRRQMRQEPDPLRAQKIELAGMADRLRHIHRTTAISIGAVEQYVAQRGYTHSWTFPRIEKDLSSSWETIRWETSRMILSGRRVLATVCPGWHELQMMPRLQAQLRTLELIKHKPVDLAERLHKRNQTNSDTGPILSPGQIVSTSPEQLMWTHLENALHSQTANRVVRTGLGIEAFRVRNGRWPENLKELDGQVPNDPYANAPLKYKQLDNGIVVYSIGQNRADDGGMQQSIDSKDIAFRLLDPKQRGTAANN
jgi:hypothetical protein